jgi:4-amino-4-deoxy-L-arabinose transferase-like glycosyltransferase
MLIAAIGIYFRPIWIIDETRYLSVAWEMWDKSSFLVPLLNGEPYHHKPPFIFWLVHLNWFLLGVNETSIRFIPMLFGFGTLVLAYKLYLTLWKEDIQGAKNTVLILAGTLIFAFYNSLFMFDIILTFWVFVGVFGIVQAVQKQTLLPFVLISLSFGFGILTKGPVILVHLLPLLLLASYWSSQKVDKSVYVKFLLAFLGGVVIALSWAIPAGIAGGEAYQHAIFWGQTADRMVNSFAHQRGIWWYLALLPLLLFPWSFHKPFYTSLKKMTMDAGLKMLLVWMLPALLIFSFISGNKYTISYLKLPHFPSFVRGF